MQINAKSYWIFCRSSKCIDSGENISQFCPLLFVSANLFLCISRTPLKTLLAQMTSFAELTIAFFFYLFYFRASQGKRQLARMCITMNMNVLCVPWKLFVEIMYSEKIQHQNWTVDKVVSPQPISSAVRPTKFTQNLDEKKKIEFPIGELFSRCIPILKKKDDDEANEIECLGLY